MTDNILKVATAALDIAWGDPEANLANVGRTLQLLGPDVDLLVLPELFSTGYVGDPSVLPELAQSGGGSTIANLTAQAARSGVAIAGSFLACSGNKYYNRAFFIEPSGEQTFYDKRHLFALSSEGELYTSGREAMPVIRYRGWNITMMVCYDLRFPVWARNRANAYDLMLVPANWPHARSYAWEHLLIARAIENQSAVIGANRSGSDDYGVYDDSSYIFDAMGNSVGRRVARRSAPAPLLTAELSLEAIREARRRLPAWKSAENFNIVD